MWSKSYVVYKWTFTRKKILEERKMEKTIIKTYKYDLTLDLVVNQKLGFFFNAV